MAIPIPDSVTLKRNKKSEALLLDKSRKWLEREERTAGIHASDILNPRRAFFQKLFPQPLEDRQVTLFLVGKVLHGFVLGALNDKVDLNVTDEGSSFNEDLGIWYSPDWDKGDVAEFKTSRAFREPSSIDDVRTYLEQLLIYMVAKNRLVAELWVLYLNLKDEQKRTAPVFRAYTVSITKDDLELVRSKIKSVRGLLEEANKTGDHTTLELCWEFLCSEKMCPFWERCKPPGRYETTGS